MKEVVSSGLPSSTTSTSNAPWSRVWRDRLSRVCRSSSRRLYVGTTTLQVTGLFTISPHEDDEDGGDQGQRCARPEDLGVAQERAHRAGHEAAEERAGLEGAGVQRGGGAG